MTDKTYDASNIRILEGLQAVRVRPGMFVGDTGKKGLHHLVSEILDNSIDEAMAGHCDTIDVILEADGETISIEDNGRGIPVDLHKDKKKSALEIVFTVLHAGGKFDGSGYEASGGLHGVGASCVNALSDKLDVEVCRDGGFYTQSYSRGVPTTKVEKIRDLTNKDKKHGTKVTFHGDSEIFKESIKFDEHIITKKLKEMSFLNKGLTITFTNNKTKIKETFLAAGGISDYVKYLTEARTGHYPASPIYVETIVPLTTREGKVSIQVALNYTVEDDETILTFANNINTNDGGTHLSGFKTALTRVVNKFAKASGALKEKETGYSGDEIREGLTAIISVRLPQPEFVGQTKNKLGTVEIEGIVNTTVSDMLNDYFDKNAAVIKKIVERAEIAREARDAARKATNLIKRKSFLGNSSRLPGKLSDCNSNKRELCELFLVEGDSAGGSSKSGRDSETQAILPLRGKVINAEKNDVTSLLANKEIQSMILAIGCGFKDEFDIEKRRYDKVILLCLAGDTKIRTLNGENKSIEDLYKENKETWIYSRYGNEIIPYLAQPPLKTTTAKEWIKIILNNGECVECTTDHLFMVNDPDIDDERIVWKKQGTGFNLPYMKAKDLKESDSLCHVLFDFKRISQQPIAYEVFKFNKKANIFTHRHVWKFFSKDEESKKYETGLYDLHHIDKNSLNNEPCNIEMLTPFEHLKKHYDGLKHSKLMKKLHEQRVYENTSHFIKYNLTDDHRINIIEKHKQGKYKLFYENFKEFNGSDKQREMLKENWEPNGVYRSEDYLKKLKDGLKKRFEDPELRKNISNNTTSQWFDEKSRLKIKTSRGRRILRDLLNEGVLVNLVDEKLFNSKRKSNDPYFNTFLKNFNSKEEMCRYFLNEEKLNFNIVKKEFIKSDDQKQFYCFNLPNVGNFVLENGLISSNCDADTDGAHICTLLMAFFYRYMKNLIVDGHLYLAQPPLYRVDNASKRTYCYSDKELTDELAKANGKGKVTRFKGLGEMDASELAETTMDKKNRKLIQLKISDFGEAERLLSTLMGNNAQLRKDHIINQVNGIINTGNKNEN